MKESFLHFIWQFQKFDASDLLDTEGNLVRIFKVGEHNSNAGPDFLNTKIKVGNMIWHGHVEIHVSSSSWNAHGHQNDPSYETVVLHVVWKNDVPILDKNGKVIPTIELKDRISNDLLSQSNRLLDSAENIPCNELLHLVKPMQVFAMQEKMAIERLENKSHFVFELLERNKGDWEETAYQLLSQNFGFKINVHPFLKLAQTLPFKLLKKHSGSDIQIEAMLFGMAGFLNEIPKDNYHSSLMNEYAFLSRKYALEGLEMNKAEWKYLRLRPANFPTVRLSQLAALLCKRSHIFDTLISFERPKNLINKLKIEPSKYWTQHYDFGKVSKKKLLGMGKSSLENVLINSAAPLLAAYSKYTNNQKYMDKAIELLQYLKPEKNNILDEWNSLNITAKNAFESQALIELYNSYCLKKQCLSCNIGVSFINRI